MARLELTHQKHVQEYDITEVTVMGRSNSCTIRIPSTKASRKHCRIYKATGGFFLEDLDSANGTLLNGVKVGRKLLKHNDIIRIGDVDVRFIDKREDPLPGRRFGRYQVIEKLSAGEEGVIYRARQVALGQEVVLKILHQDYLRISGGVENIQQQADVRILLQQQNIIRTFEFAEFRNRYYYVLEYLPGENLYDSLIRQGHLKADDVLKYGADIAAALEYMHSFGVIHGNIRPSAVLVTGDNRAVVYDPGIMARLSDSIELAGHEDIAALFSEKEKDFLQLAYVAPELFRLDRAVVESDVYSLCALLYQLLSGRLPFLEDRRDRLLAAKLQRDIPSLSAGNREISPELEELIFAGLSFDPADRPQSAREVRERLERLRVSKKTALSVPALRKETVMKKNRAERIHAGQSFPFMRILLVVLLLGLGAFFGYRQYEKYQLRRQQQLEKDFRQAQEFYRQKDFTRARALYAAILEGNPPAEMADEAQKRLKLMMLSQAQLELVALQEKLAGKEITDEEMLAILRRRLRSGNLNEREKSEYSAFLASIGGDEDIRYPWQKEADSLRASGRVLQAYQALVKINIPLTEDLELAEYRRYREALQAELNKAVTAEYSRAAELIKQGRGQEAFTLLDEIVNSYPPELGWRGRIIAYLAQAGLHQGDMLLKYYQEALAAVVVCDMAGLQEKVFQLEEQQARMLVKRSVLSMGSMGEFLQSYLDELNRKLAVDPVSEQGSGQFAEMTGAGGRSENVELVYKEGRYLALEQGSSRVVSLAEIAVPSLEKICGLFDLNEKAVIGAGLYFIARGSIETGKGYLYAAVEGRYGKAAQDYLALTDRELPVSIEQTGTRKIALADAVSIGGSRFIWNTQKSPRTVFASSTGKDFSLEIDGERLKVRLGEEQLAEITVPAGRKMLELVGYWDKMLVQSEGVVLGEISREKFGELALAPYYPVDGLKIFLKFAGR